MAAATLPALPHDEPLLARSSPAARPRGARPTYVNPEKCVRSSAVVDSLEDSATESTGASRVNSSSKLDTTATMSRCSRVGDTKKGIVVNEMHPPNAR